MSGQIPSNINPNTTSGTDLANILNLFKDAFASTNSGTSRPTNIQQGGLWWDTTNIATPNFLVVLKMYDGSDDITMLTLNISNNTISITDSDSTFRITKLSNDSVGPILKLIKARIATDGQTESGDTLGQIQFIGKDDGGLFPTICEIRAVATDDVTPTAQGGYLVFLTTDDATGTMLEKMRLVDGKLGIGTSTPESLLHVFGALGARVQAALTDNAVGALFTFRKKRTANSGRVDSGDDIGKLSFNSTDNAGTEITEAATIEVSAVENHTTTAQGSQIRFYVKKATQNTKSLIMTFADTVTVAVASSFSALATFTADLRIKSASVSHYVTLKAKSGMSASYDFIFPPNAATQGKSLVGAATPGETEWVDIDRIAEYRNGIFNSNFHLWSRGNGGAADGGIVNNGTSKYGADFWLVKNSLGTNGQLVWSRQTSSLDGSASAMRLVINFAPTSSQNNGTELFYIPDNIDSKEFYNSQASFGINIKARGNVNEVGLQFMYATSETTPSNTIGSEVTVSVNTSTHTFAEILGQALGTGMGANGIVGVRIRITGVSTGNLYAVNNGFEVERAVMNKGTVTMDWQPRMPKSQEIIAAKTRFQNDVPVSNIIGNDYLNSNSVRVVAAFPVRMRSTPVEYVSTASPPTNAFRSSLDDIIDMSNPASALSRTSLSAFINSANRSMATVDIFTYTSVTGGMSYMPGSVGSDNALVHGFDADIY